MRAVVPHTIILVSAALRDDNEWQVLPDIMVMQKAAQHSGLP